jgi:membrane protease YdiL (CAAX protease family)
MILRIAVIATSIAAEIAAWQLIFRGEGSVWRTLIPISALAGVLAIVLGPEELSGRVDVIEAFGVGVGSGTLLYAGTLVFVDVASRWGTFGRDVARTYSSAAGASTATALVLSAAIAAPSEEVFWRGLTIGILRLHTSATVAGVIAWFGYVIVKLSARSLPVLAGAIVGGALWTVLAVWTGGVLASVCSHTLWTALMVSLPPARAARGSG